SRSRRSRSSSSRHWPRRPAALAASGRPVPDLVTYAFAAYHRPPMRGPRMIVALFLALSAAALLASAASANDNAQNAVAGANSKWFSGTLLQLPGENCSVLGNPYTETMVSAISEYGGAPNGDIPSVGQPYWVAVLISIPGNPCGPGSSSVA